jgi:hypothetical protein
MFRRTGAIVFALMIHPALLHAQDAVVTIAVESADVYKGPSNVTPVVGHAARGAVLSVSRNLGSWLKVPWPGAPDGVGYVHVSMVRFGSPNGNSLVMPTTASRTPSASASQSTIPARPPAGTGERTVVRSQQDGTTISHIIGVGGQVGSMSSVGATARAWRENRLGVQVGFTREAMTSDVAAGRVTSTQFEPAVVYALLDDVRDYVWVRPYVGSGLSFRHQTFTDPAAVLEPASKNGIGLRVFAGSELTFAGVTRFGLSLEVGYRRLPEPFPGFEPGRVSASVAGHWYIR